MSKYIDTDKLKAEIERRKCNAELGKIEAEGISSLNYNIHLAEENLCLKLLFFLDSLPEQPVSDHHEIEVEFRGEKVTISREFYRDGERNYSTREQDDNAIWSALRAWCEKKGITPFELYPKQSEQPVENPKKGVPKYPLSVIADLLGSTPPGPVVFVPEQPVEGLEEAADKYSFKYSDFDTEDGGYNVYDHEKREAFIAGAEWQKKLDDLETADLLAIAHLQGMEQQKSKMLEDAMECMVMDFSSNLPRPQVDVRLDPGKYHTGDKVKIIVIKEDEK